MKPALDWLVAFLALLLLMPLLLAIALALVVTTGASPLFRQARIGLHGRIFYLLKFRSMTNARGPDGTLRPDSDRITPLGYWLRRTSLDELPQLMNVLMGQMSLVGPRPLLAEYDSAVGRYPRHQTRPGLTGWAQVHGRNALSWNEKFALDAWYVANRCFWVDCQILWRTLPVLLDTSPPAQRLLSDEDR
ncbi:sugar transferase [Rudanella paleaurantiibacter]|uniref:Sugar transferase n=1 Tax=Rudanella paleaurantiibacter TaxID=2614655 RepID=A0A7J5TXU9_9BACT|nr:sugar transferase [Rudanella paleaurantiibacter]